MGRRATAWTLLQYLHQRNEFGRYQLKNVQPSYFILKSTKTNTVILPAYLCFVHEPSAFDRSPNNTVNRFAEKKNKNPYCISFLQNRVRTRWYSCIFFFFFYFYWKFSSLVLQNLESQEKKNTMHKDTLSREHRYLRRRLDQLTTTLNVNKRRSVSESSSYTTASGASTTSSACSTSSSPSISESGTNLYSFFFCFCFQNFITFDSALLPAPRAK